MHHLQIGAAAICEVLGGSSVYLSANITQPLLLPSAYTQDHHPNIIPLLMALTLSLQFSFY